MRVPFRIAPAGLLTLLALASVARPAPAAAPQTTVPDPGPFAVALGDYLEQHHLAGAVSLVATADEILRVEAAGWADLETCRPMSPDALFLIASQSKPIVATALFLLVEQGLVDLEAPVETYLPEFHGQWMTAERDEDRLVLRRPAHPIRVRELLTHTSGLPFRSAVEEPTLDGLPLGESVMSYALSPLEFEPGTRYLYSNAGFNTLGRIVEVLSGMPFEEFLEVRLFAPLGMVDTTFFPDEGQLARLALCYEPEGPDGALVQRLFPQFRQPLSRRDRHAVPAGGLFSTARDVARFCQMILRGGTLDGRRYLSAESIAEMTRKQTGPGIQQRYGFGWAVGESGFGHTGLYRTQMFLEPRKGRIWIFMAQQSRFAGEEGEELLEGFRRRDPVNRR